MTLSNSAPKMLNFDYTHAKKWTNWNSDYIILYSSFPAFYWYHFHVIWFSFECATASTVNMPKIDQFKFWLHKSSALEVFGACIKEAAHHVVHIGAFQLGFNECVLSNEPACTAHCGGHLLWVLHGFWARFLTALDFLIGLEGLDFALMFRSLPPGGVDM